MPWTDPADPVSGTGITRAWAVTNVTNLLRWLRALTGSADPPGAGYSIESISTTATTWIQKVSRGGDTMTFDLQINRTALSAPTTGYLILGNSTAYYVGNDGAQIVISPPGGGVQITAGDITTTGASAGITLGASTGTRGRLYDASGALTVLRAHNNAFGVYTSDLATLILGADNAAAAPTFKGNAIFHAGNDTRIGVPLGAVVWFRTLAEVTAAGASWTRETNLDGRLPIGAGTTFSQTFAEATNYGANWTPSSGITIGTVPVLADGQTLLVNTGAITSIATASHTHPAPTLGGLTTAWLPPMRAGIWARRI